MTDAQRRAAERAWRKVNGRVGRDGFAIQATAEEVIEAIGGAVAKADRK